MKKTLIFSLIIWSSSGVFVIFVVFSQLVLSSVGHLACGGGGHDRLFLLVFNFVSLPICLLCFRFLSDCFLSFLCLI